jgi:membrane-bound transcription factor site-1 protease
MEITLSWQYCIITNESAFLLISSDQVMEGYVEILNSNTLMPYSFYYASGTTISSFPVNNSYLYFADLNDQKMEVVTGVSSHHRAVPILGLHQTSSSSKGSSATGSKDATVEATTGSKDTATGSKDTTTAGSKDATAGSKDTTAGSKDTAAGSSHSSGGRVAVFGDSNCIDSAHLQSDCFKLLDEILNYLSNGVVPNFINPAVPLSPAPFTPERMEGNRLHQFSKVLDPVDPHQFRPLPACPQFNWAKPRPINISSQLMWDNKSSEAGRGLLTLGQPPEDIDADTPLSHPWLVPWLILASLGILYYLMCCRKRTRSRRSVLLSKLPVV